MTEPILKKDDRVEVSYFYERRGTIVALVRTPDGWLYYIDFDTPPFSEDGNDNVRYQLDASWFQGGHGRKLGLLDLIAEAAM